MIACMPRRDDSKISKTLTLQPFGDKGDWYLGLDVKDAARQENSVKLGLPLTGGELHTIRALSEVKYASSLDSSYTSLGIGSICSPEQILALHACFDCEEC